MKYDFDINKIIYTAEKMSSNIISKTDFNIIYNTNNDFSRMDPTKKRLLVLGCSGSGKSTLLNRLAGYQLSWNDEGTKLIWMKQPPFVSTHGTSSITKTTCYANIKTPESSYFENLVVIDTVGHDDPDISDISKNNNRNKLSEQAGDLYEKLKRIGHLNTIMVLHNDITSNRLNAATFTLLEKINQMFYKSDKNIWEHVIIVYSKCDTDTIGWKDDLEKKKLDLQKEIKNKFPECKTDIPIFTLSGLDTPTDNIESSLELNSLYNFINNSCDYPTDKIIKFEGLHNKLEKIIKEKDYYCRISSARQDFITLTFYFVIFTTLLCLRNIFLPFLDLNTSFDELIFLSILIYIIGPIKFIDWLFVCWDDHIIPFLKRKEIISVDSNLYFLGNYK